MHLCATTFVSRFSIYFFVFIIYKCDCVLFSTKIVGAASAFRPFNCCRVRLPQVEVKRAVPKSEAPPPRNSSGSHQNTGYSSNAQLRRRPPSARMISDQTHDSTGYPSYASKARRAAAKTHAPPLQNPWNTRNHAQNFKQYNSPQPMQQLPPPNYDPRYDNRQMQLNMLPPADEVPTPTATAASTTAPSESAETSSSTPVAQATPDVAEEEPPQPVTATPPSPEPEADNPAASDDATDTIVQSNAAPDTGFDVDSYATLSPSAEASAAESTEHLTTAPGTASSTRSTRGGGRAFSMFDFATRPDGDASSGDPLLKPNSRGSAHMILNAVPPPAHSDVDPVQQRPPAPAVGPKPMAHPQQQMLMHPFAYPPHSFPPPHHLPYDQPFMPPRQPVGAPVEDDFGSNFTHLNITPRMDPPPHMHPMMGHRMHGMGYPSRNFPHGSVLHNRSYTPPCILILLAHASSLGTHTHSFSLLFSTPYSIACRQQPFGYDSVPPELDQHAPRGYGYDAPGSYDMGYGGVPHPPQYSYPPPQHPDAGAGPRT